MSMQERQICQKVLRHGRRCGILGFHQKLKSFYGGLQGIRCRRRIFSNTVICPLLIYAPCVGVRIHGAMPWLHARWPGVFGRFRMKHWCQSCLNTRNPTQEFGYLILMRNWTMLVSQGWSSRYGQYGMLGGRLFINPYFRAPIIQHPLSIITLTSWDTLLLEECMNILLLLHHHNRTGGFLHQVASRRLMLMGLWYDHGEEVQLLPYAATRRGTIWALRRWFIMGSGTP